LFVFGVWDEAAPVRSCCST